MVACGWLKFIGLKHTELGNAMVKLNVGLIKYEHTICGLHK